MPKSKISKSLNISASLNEEYYSIKSPHRVLKYAEVLTSPREVNAMLDFVKQETERIDSRFLEPACGTGNFLIEILRRKLKIIENRYYQSQIEFERASFTAISSLYGIDLLQDNVEHCRARLFNEFQTLYNKLFKSKINKYFLKSLKFVLDRNIICGDALTLEKNGLIKGPIIFSEWSLVTGSTVQRRDFQFESLIKNQKMDVPNLFSDLGDEAFIPVPVKTYPLQNIYNLSEYVQLEL